MQLNKIQSLFVRTMLDHPDKVRNPDSSLSDLFKNDGSLPERLQIYRNNIVGSLQDALLATYPLLGVLTGNEFATQLVRAYILTHPPHEGHLTFYGEGLPSFIESYAPAEGLPYLAEFTRLEWAYNQSYAAPDDIAMSPNDLQGLLGEPDLAGHSLPLRSSSVLISSYWPLTAIRNFCLKPEAYETLDLSQGGCRLLIHRPLFTPEILHVTSSDYLFLSSLAAHHSIGQALENTLAQDPEFSLGLFLETYLPLHIFLKSTS